MHVQEPAELAADLLERADVSEAGVAIQIEARVAALGHSRDERVKPQAPRLLDRCGLELTADPAASMVRADVKGCFSGVCIGTSVRVFGEAGPAHYMTLNDRDEDRVSIVVRVKPLSSFGEALGLDVERRSCGENSLVVDLGNGLEVGELCTSDRDVHRIVQRHSEGPFMLPYLCRADGSSSDFYPIPVTVRGDFDAGTLFGEESSQSAIGTQHDTEFGRVQKATQAGEQVRPLSAR